MPVTEMITGVAAGLFFLTGFVYFLRMLQAWLLHRTLRAAIKQNSTIAEHLADKIDGRESVNEDARGDDRNGLVLIALGIALAGFSIIVNDPQWLRYGLGAALFPALVGLALLGRHFWLRRSERDFAAGS